MTGPRSSSLDIAMKGPDVLTLAACLLALLQYGDSVPTRLHEQIQAAKSQLSNGKSQAVQQLVSAIEEDEQLSELFQASFTHLLNQPSQQKERAKSAIALSTPASAALSAPSPPLSLAVPRPNSWAPSGRDLTESDRLNLLTVATEILDAPDGNYWAKAQHFFNQPQHRKQLEKSTEDIKAIASAANQLHPNKIALMKKLDISPFTIDDIAYILDVPLGRAQHYAKSLWNEGYVGPLSNSFIGQMWLSVKGPQPLDQMPAAETYLTLTAKGYFYLHPGAIARRKAA